jgi:uncharacterized protein (TIGR00369 family)
MEKLIEIYNQVNHFGRENNMILTIVKPGEIIYEMEIKDNHLATVTTAHGGVIAAMMDGVLGVAALSLVAQDRKLVSTVEFKLNYFKPAYLGDVLKGHGKVDFSGRRILSCSGEIYNQKGDLVAKAMGTFNSYPFEKSDMVDLKNL